MIRLSTLIITGGIVAASALVFRISYDVAALEQRLDNTNREIVRERDAIRVLRAEWAYMNRPERLRQLAGAYSALGPARGSQIALTVDEIPEPLDGTLVFSVLPVPGLKPDAASGAARGPSYTTVSYLDGADLADESFSDDSSPRIGHSVAVDPPEPDAQAEQEAAEALAADSTEGLETQSQMPVDAPAGADAEATIDTLLADFSDRDSEASAEEPDR